MPPAFFTSLRNTCTTASRSQSPVLKEVGLKLAITLRQLTTGETYTSLHYHMQVTLSVKFIPVVCQAIFAEYQEEYLICPTDPEDWRKVKQKVRATSNVPHAFGALDGKHITMKEPNKYGSEYYNYKGFFPLCC